MRWLITAALAMTPLRLAAAPSHSISVVLDPKAFHDISFPGTVPTQYRPAKDGTLAIQVRQSASFLLQAYSKPIQVVGLHFTWRSTGDLRVPSAEAEHTQAGDDFRLRIGLLLAGPKPLLPFFAPAWVKACRDVLRLPSNRILYVVAGAKSPGGMRWTSPYSDSITLLAASSETTKDGWQRSSASFPEVAVVGLWLMADGDNTGSTFQTMLKSLTLAVK